jgi:hypothetical protein
LQVSNSAGPSFNGSAWIWFPPRKYPDWDRATDVAADLRQFQHAQELGRDIAVEQPPGFCLRASGKTDRASRIGSRIKARPSYKGIGQTENERASAAPAVKPPVL